MLHQDIEVVAKIKIIRHMNEEKISPTGLTGAETPSGTPRPSHSGLQQTAKQAAQAAQTEIEKLKGAAREQGSAAVEEIKTVAQSAAREAQEAGRDFVHEQKENLAQRVHKYAEALRAASCRLKRLGSNGPCSRSRRSTFCHPSRTASRSKFHVLADCSGCAADSN